MLEPINVSLESLNLITLAPMLIAIAGGLIILIIDLLNGKLHKSLYVMLTILVLFVDFGSVLGLNVNERGFFVDRWYIYCIAADDHWWFNDIHTIGIDIQKIP